MKTMAAMLVLLLSLPWIVFPLGPTPMPAPLNHQETDQEADQETVPVPDESSVERRDFMRTKLMYSQNIFEGLTIRNFELIERGIHEVEQLLEAEQWVTIDSEDYRKLTAEFKTSLKRMKVTAESKNIEATALRFYDMSNRCIDCHQHLRHAQYHF